MLGFSLNIQLFYDTFHYFIFLQEHFFLFFKHKWKYFDCFRSKRIGFLSKAAKNYASQNKVRTGIGWISINSTKQRYENIKEDDDVAEETVYSTQESLQK